MKFKFKEPKFEQQLEREQEQREGEKKLEKFIGEIATKLRLEGVPVNFDCRIDMAEFKEVYPQEEIEKDKNWVKSYEEKWEKETEGGEKIKRTGEKLEMLKTAIFHKFLKENFIVVRASLYDDIKNKVDNLILDKETGNLICAFDEVGEIAGQRYEEKKTKILERDIKEKGAQLKYGLKLEKNEKGEKELTLEKTEKVPILYLALEKKHIEEGIKNLIPSFSEKSKYEEKLWNYFKVTFNAQIQSLNLEKNLEPTLKSRLNQFQKILQ
jgi:hypothetical protein